MVEMVEGDGELSGSCGLDHRERHKAPMAKIEGLLGLGNTQL